MRCFTLNTRTQCREISSLGGREGVLEDDWITAISKPPGRRCIREILAPTLCMTPTVIAKSFTGINPFELGAYILRPKAWNHHIYLPCQTWLHRVTILSLKQLHCIQITFFPGTCQAVQRRLNRMCQIIPGGLVSWQRASSDTAKNTRRVVVWGDKISAPLGLGHLTVGAVMSKNGRFS